MSESTEEEEGGTEREQEGGGEEGMGEGMRERERKQCHSVQEALLQSTLPRHEGTSAVTRAQTSAENFFLLLLSSRFSFSSHERAIL